MTPELYGPNRKSDETNMLNRKFGERLKIFRMARGYSQTQFANLLGKSQSVVSSWEIGNSAPDLGTLFLIARALGEPVTNLLPLEDSGNPTDMDQRILYIVHHDPRWETFFSRCGRISDAGWTAVFSLLDAVSVEDDA